MRSGFFRASTASAVCIVCAVSFASAQEGSGPPSPPGATSAPPPNRTTPLPRPVMPPVVPVPVKGDTSLLQLTAAFGGETRPIRSGLIWRVFPETGGDGVPTPVAQSAAAAPSIAVPPGIYIVHAAYGLASATKRVTIGNGATIERLTLSAGALKLGGAIGDVPIPSGKLSFSVYMPVGNDLEGRLVASTLKAGDVVRLPEGAYHVVSNYGGSNANMRADLRVDSGRLTEATLNHRAATVTLKLVASLGGEAFAGTAFSVLTPGGDVIREAIGSFPVVTLAEGNYTLIARNDGKVHTREFTVESGLDRDIEVVAKS